MSLTEIIALFVVMAILALVPSASVALVVARSSTSGFLNGCAVSAGIVVGDLIFVVLAVFGMAALAEVMGGLFLILKFLAGAYLIWFGIGILRSKPSSRLADADRSASTLSASFLSGLTLTLGDVKAIFFYASLLPAFIDPAAIKTLDIVNIIVLTIVAVGGVKLGYAYSAIRIVSFARGFKGERVVKVAAGAFMVVLGAYLMANTSPLIYGF